MWAKKCGRSQRSFDVRPPIMMPTVIVHRGPRGRTARLVRQLLTESVLVASTLAVHRPRLIRWSKVQILSGPTRYPKGDEPVDSARQRIGSRLAEPLTRSKDPKSMYQPPSGAIDSDRTHFCNRPRSASEICRSWARSNRCCHRPRGRSEKRVLDNRVLPEDRADQILAGLLLAGGSCSFMNRR